MFRNSLVIPVFEEAVLQSVSVDRNLYFDLLKNLKYLKATKIDPNLLTFDEVRQMTIQTPVCLKTASLAINKSVVGLGDIALNPPDQWLPPRACIERLINLVEIQCNYYASLGSHDSELPNQESSCIVLDDNTNSYIYDFGPEAKCKNLSELFIVDQNVMMDKLAKAKSDKNNTRKSRKRPIGSHATDDQNALKHTR